MSTKISDSFFNKIGLGKFFYSIKFDFNHFAVNMIPVHTYWVSSPIELGPSAFCWNEVGCKNFNNTYNIPKLQTVLTLKYVFLECKCMKRNIFQQEKWYICTKG